MNDAYRPPAAELREPLASARPFRNASVGFGTSLMTLLVPMSTIFFLFSNTRSFQWDRAAFVVLVPSLLVGIAAAALPRLPARTVVLWALPASLLGCAVAIYVAMRWIEMLR